MLSRPLATLSCIAVACLSAPSLAQSRPSEQPNPLAQIEVDVVVDSGAVWSTSDSRTAVWAGVVHVPDAPWVRLQFDAATLGPAPAGGAATILRITSFLDGHVQYLNAMHLEQWRYTSAYFNGDAVLVEIIAEPDAAASQITITKVWAGIQIDTQSICGSVDDRELSDDIRVGRMEPSGCTAWLIDDVNHCMLTAGHCVNNEDLIEFNVPLSDSNGNAQHPGPEDQYIIDQTSLQSQNGGIGNDWGYLGCFRNPNTFLTAAEAQGDWFVLAASAPNATGQNIRITGYGTTTSPVNPMWDGAQKTHAGPYVGSPGTQVDYTTDTTGGNSGSPVIDDSTGLAIGIHTHGGCNSSGSNHGTAIEQGNLQSALANPLGVCRPTPDNDDCSQAIDVSAGVTLFDSEWATTDGFPEGICIANGDSDVGSDIWYRYVPSCDRDVTFDLCGSDFNTRLALYQTGCPVAANFAIACDDDGSCDSTSTISMSLDGGTTYMVRVGGTFGATGTGMLTIVEGECARTAPTNDGCGGSMSLSDGVGFSTLNASTTGPAEGAVCDTGGTGQIDNDLWYRYTADCDGMLTIGVCDADFDTRIAVYGMFCPAGPGEIIACNDDGCGLQSSVTFAASAGSIYRVRVGGADGAAGAGTFSVSCSTGLGCTGDTNGDGFVNVDDLNNVILDWGTDGSANGGDITGTTPGSPPDGAVDVDDLNAVIVNWGVCP